MSFVLFFFSSFCFIWGPTGYGWGQAAVQQRQFPVFRGGDTHVPKPRLQCIVVRDTAWSIFCFGSTSGEMADRGM